MKTRLSVLKNALKKQNLDSAIIINPLNIRYLTNFTGTDSWAVLIKNTLYLITDSRYTEQAQKQCPCKIIQRDKSLINQTAQLLKQNSVFNTAIEDSVNFKTFTDLKKALKNKLTTISDIVDKARSIKDLQEIQYIKKAAKIAAAALEETTSKIKTGITEAELAATLDFNIKKRGSTNGFDTIVAFGANASMAHHHPTLRKLKKNDTILIDFGAKYNGYTCDITRCLTVGKIDNFYATVYRAVLEAQKAALSVLKSGILVSQVEKAARAVLEKYNLPQYGHGTGHGIGLYVHEQPVISERIKNAKLLSGNIITIEPAVYIPGKLGIRIEDDVLIKKDGYEILTTCVKKITKI
jgi:Xaa-Pro aminopeptidase